MLAISGALARTGLLLAIVAAVAGCNVRVIGADSAREFAAEDQYRAAYEQGVAKVVGDTQAFAPSTTTPGVCNKGGSKQGCYDADTAVIADLNQVVALLTQVSVPARFANGDRLLKAAIAKDIRALEMRNEAIANSDDTLWAAHKPLLDQAIADLHAAYLAFPEDNRPLPAL